MARTSGFIRWRNGAVGCAAASVRPYPGPGDRLQAVPAGHTGELIIRGPNLMQGYWNRLDATGEAFAGGWFHTGDLAQMDTDGDLTIVDRKKDMFISGGENVYPAEVENAIYDLPQVAETAVIGTPDQKWGEVGYALIVLKPDESIPKVPKSSPTTIWF